jgi:hypothetical protein
MMNTKTRQRAMRSFLAALLQSDLTIHVIRQLADDLNFGSFGRELAEYIQEVMHLGDFDSLKDVGKHSRESAIPVSAVNSAMDIISKRKLSKKVVAQLMGLASPWMKLSQIENSGSTKEIIEKYMLLATSADVSKFLSILEGEPADAYMKGIARRNRAK